MHNGVGLPTARGSGTSGRVQSNKFLLRSRPSPSPSGGPRDPTAAPNSTSSVPGYGGIREEMAEHERRRAVEVWLLELRDALEEQGYTQAEVDARLAEALKAAETKAAAAAKEAHGGGGCRWPKGTAPF